MNTVARTTISSTGNPLANELADGVSVVYGIDVSTYQGTIDWQEVATKSTAQGQSIGFAYIKATDGSDLVDSRFATNWRNSKGLLPRGAYHFFYATSTNDEAGSQANNFIRTLTEALAATGEEILELPPMVDVEWGSVPETVTAEQAISSLQYYLSLVEQAFHKRPVIYTGLAFWQQCMGNSQAFSRNYLLWLASYGAQHTDDDGFDPPALPSQLPGGWNSFAAWQNAVQKGVAGIQGLVDRDRVLLPAGSYVVDFFNQVNAFIAAAHSAAQSRTMPS